MPVDPPHHRMYEKHSEFESLMRILLWFATGFGCFEVTCILLVLYYLYSTNQGADNTTQGYILAATGFKRFSYGELKKVTHGFSEEIGRGAGGIVYKGTLSDGRVAAIKRLNEANQGEAEFLAEISSIGKLNHMNLIKMWGYCVEGKHRLLVYEHIKHGSLAENLSSNQLQWDTRFEIAVGTAKGKSPTGNLSFDHGGLTAHGRLVTWVKEKMNKAAATRDHSWVEEIFDPSLGCEYDINKMEVLVRVALLCLEEDKDSRPTMRQVVEMLASQQ
ncbi:hypothetical protein LWI29_035227 [Acer saccharum]|uniref:non-specific serine/threonine protein kinase n=1 Tax=Acer saccharum TaxID=4024 RepID=A0AA39VEZ3_ACESA|nr:hypothetical protein LWI29_035227 [Acer saccharum]